MDINKLIFKYGKPRLAELIGIKSRSTLDQKIKTGKWTSEEIKKMIKL